MCIWGSLIGFSISIIFLLKVNSFQISILALQTLFARLLSHLYTSGSATLTLENSLLLVFCHLQTCFFLAPQDPLRLIFSQCFSLHPAHSSFLPAALFSFPSYQPPSELNLAINTYLLIILLLFITGCV